MKRLATLLALICLTTYSLLAQSPVKFTASDINEDDRFGASVSIDGDYAVIGTFRQDTVYVITKSGQDWTEQAKLTASGVQNGDIFGHEVVISGEYIFVSAPKRGGTVYIFKRDANSWTEQGNLVSPDPSEFGFFGGVVAVSGDYIFVSETSKNIVHIFKREGTSWTHRASITSPSNEPLGDRFGWSVALDGDYAIIGAHHDDEKGAFSGAAHIYKHEDNLWTEQAKITLPFGNEFKQFGFQVDIDGDYAIVGTDNQSLGSAYIFKREGSNWIQQVEFFAPDGAQGFGRVVSIHKNYATVNNTREILFYKHEDSNWLPQQSFEITAVGEESSILGPVSFSDDHIIVGAFLDDENGFRTGAVYIFEVPTESRVSTSDRPELPTQVVLNQNYPNPFSSNTTISYTIPEAQHVTISVFDLLGHEVVSLVNHAHAAGTHQTAFDASELSAGVYVYRLVSSAQEENKILTVVK